jgi:hypothetical protein
MLKCEMLVLHHPDCECKICLKHEDEECEEPSAGTCHDMYDSKGRAHSGVQTCKGCALLMEDEGFFVTYTLN